MRHQHLDYLGLGNRVLEHELEREVDSIGEPEHDEPGWIFSIYRISPKGAQGQILQ
jgi:hypothetical protein